MVKAKKKKQEYEREAEVRAGWKRHTTYFRREYVDYLKTYANNNNLFVMDVIDEIFGKWIKKQSAKGTRTDS